MASLSLYQKSAKAHGKNCIKVKPHLVNHLWRNHLLDLIEKYDRSVSSMLSNSFPPSKFSQVHVLSLLLYVNASFRQGADITICL